MTRRSKISGLRIGKSASGSMNQIARRMKGVRQSRRAVGDRGGAPTRTSILVAYAGVNLPLNPECCERPTSPRCSPATGPVGDPLAEKTLSFTEKNRDAMTARHSWQVMTQGTRFCRRAAPRRDEHRKMLDEKQIGDRMGENWCSASTRTVWQTGSLFFSI